MRETRPVIEAGTPPLAARPGNVSRHAGKLPRDPRQRRRRVRDRRRATAERAGAQSRPFIAIDGEGITAEDGSHRYILLAASNGRTRFAKRGLKTFACFKFLLDLKAENPDAIFVAFGLNYDVNMILSDLPRELLEELWREGRVPITFKNHRLVLEWIPGKFFEIYSEGRRVKIFDVWAFFQSSFVVAINKWAIGKPAERALVEARKGERSHFDLANAAEIKRYCKLECRMLVQLCNRLRAALERAHIVPQNWYGPGAVASRVLRAYKIQDYRVADSDWPAPIARAIMHAYFGGRVEMFQQGHFERGIFYDINSAYPWGCAQLPALKGGRWERRKSYDPRAAHALYLVRWNENPNRPVQPLPFRTRHKRILYPARGKGWYHACEIARVIEAFPSLEILDGYIFHPPTDEKPFAFIPEYFSLRREMKEQNDSAEHAYKLALNSMYGKLAQGFGYRGQMPPFQCYFWAGEITARTRARMLTIMLAASDAVVFCATDGLAFTRPLDLEESDALGGISAREFTNMFVAQSGIYQCFFDGKDYSRSRGFFVRDLDFIAIREAWTVDGFGGKFPHVSRRFIGIGAALMRTEFHEHWKRWADIPRELKFHSDSKFYPQSDYGTARRNYRLLAPDAVREKLSLPYTPKGSGLDDAVTSADYVSGFEQPVISG